MRGSADPGLRGEPVTTSGPPQSPERAAFISGSMGCRDWKCRLRLALLFLKDVFDFSYYGSKTHLY